MPADHQPAFNGIWTRVVSVPKWVGAVAFFLLALSGTAHAFTPCDADEAGSRSPHSQAPIVIGYENQESYTQQWIWIDFDGRRRVYKTLQPGEAVQQPTFVGHVWVVTGPSGECQALFVAGEGG